MSPARPSERARTAVRQHGGPPVSWTRRARPLLGTLVEIGVPAGADHGPGFAALDAVQRQLSRFDPGSDIARFNALPADHAIDVQADTLEVLVFARTLQARSGDAFDVSLGSGPHGWHFEGQRLHKHHAAVHLDLGGVGKGHAVDRAVQALQAAGVQHGWVNAGGDLRAFGDLDLPVCLRDEARGGTTPFIHLADGAFATSHYAAHSRCTLHGARGPAHVSVAAPTCRWADALTKLVALGLEDSQRLLDDARATAWWH